MAVRINRLLRARGARTRSFCSIALPLAAVVAITVTDVAVARPYFEEHPPSGAYAGKPPRGYVLLIHGGGWYLVGAGMVGLMDSTADRLNAAGYESLNVDYRPGQRSLRDVLVFYDRLRRQVGRKVKICTYGDSAGGNLALLVAQRRPDVACVVANAAPTDLGALPGGAKGLRQTAIRLFGPKSLRKWSPAARTLKQPALLAYGRRDSAVPIDQGRRMLRRAPRAKLVAMHKGNAPWIHVNVAPQDLRLLYNAQLNLLRSVR